ncbi:MAG TPA: hypothetical protein VNC84_04755 [Gammaproteobacteria bacterium]|jgi:hypothetical protein|nr:hypothetical protein [Gammaproteobacteria bacterium]
MTASRTYSQLCATLDAASDTDITQWLNENHENISVVTNESGNETYTFTRNDPEPDIVLDPVVTLKTFHRHVNELKYSEKIPFLLRDRLVREIEGVTKNIEAYGKENNDIERIAVRLYTSMNVLLEAIHQLAEDPNGWSRAMQDHYFEARSQLKHDANHLPGHRNEWMMLGCGIMTVISLVFFILLLISPPFVCAAAVSASMTLCHTAVYADAIMLAMAGLSCIAPSGFVAASIWGLFGSGPFSDKGIAGAVKRAVGVTDDIYIHCRQRASHS